MEHIREFHKAKKVKKKNDIDGVDKHLVIKSKIK